jgi:mono/diheme cytochrome c family protein
MWITLWWSKDPDPDGLPGRWAHYKMCIVTAYQETDPSLPAGSTFCSNPYLETGPRNVQTNCIGCHQHGGTALSNTTILGYPDYGRPRSLSVFPYDYLWAASGNLRLAEQTAAIVDQLTP